MVDVIVLTFIEQNITANTQSYHKQKNFIQRNKWIINKVYLVYSLWFSEKLIRTYTAKIYSTINKQ